MAREKDDFASGQSAGEQIIRGRAERRFDRDPFLPGESFDMIEAAASDDANALGLHE